MDNKQDLIAKVAEAKELQAIIDEAWKNPEFQAASKN